MKVTLSCSQCLADYKKNPTQDLEMFLRDPFLADLNEDGVYVGKCTRSHKLEAIISHPKFEMLFQSGALAFIYGFHREAISSAATSLERFFEFCTFALWEKLGVKEEEATRAWKELSKQSERQLGAFYSLYLALLKTPFPVSEFALQKLVTTRNKVIHQGVIPTREGTKGFLKDVFELIDESSRRLEAHCGDEMTKICLRETEHRRERAIAKGIVSSDAPTLGIGYLVVGGMHAEDESFDERMQILWRQNSHSIRRMP